MMRDFAAAIAIIVLAMPSPQVQAKRLIASTCMGGQTAVRIPMDPAQPDRYDCCRKGCHIASGRRKKCVSGRTDCC